MSHSAGIGTFDRFAAGVIVFAAGACGFAAIAGFGTFSPSLAGAVRIEARGATVQVTRDGEVLKQTPEAFAAGDSVAVVSGRPVIHVPGGTVQLEPGALVDIQLPLKIDRAIAIVRGTGVHLDLRGVSAVIDGVAQVERGYSTQVAVLSGSAIVESLGRVLPLAERRQVTLPGPGLMPLASDPLHAPLVAQAAGASASPGPTPRDQLASQPGTTGAQGVTHPPSMVGSPVAVAIQEPVTPPALGVVSTAVDGQRGLLGGLLEP